jgi:hypothetical protein
VIKHEDPKPELLCAAVCDDEIIKAIGRGRGVTRMVADPLEVQVLADVGLPLISDHVFPWASCVPDVFQQMLLAGLAVDSPADAAALHPSLFISAEAAKMAFQRVALGANPYRYSLWGFTP